MRLLLSFIRVSRGEGAIKLASVPGGEIHYAPRQACSGVPQNDARQRPVVANATRPRIPASGSRGCGQRARQGTRKGVGLSRQLGIPVKSRTLRKDDAWCNLYYFDDLDHARLFHVMFGGELITQGENGLTKPQG
jgi:hypothetical protein